MLGVVRAVAQRQDCIDQVTDRQLGAEVVEGGSWSLAGAEGPED